MIESKGVPESTVKIAEADLAPTEANLLPAYESFAEVRAACDAFCETVNAREHRETRQPPVERLAAECRRLHPIADVRSSPPSTTAQTPEEIAFLDIGGGAERWLILAEAAGAERITTKTRQADRACHPRRPGTG